MLLSPQSIILRTPAINYPLEAAQDFLLAFAQSAGLRKDDFLDFTIVRKSLDLRHKYPQFNVVLDLWVSAELAKSSALCQCKVVNPSVFKPEIVAKSEHVAVVGSGPSGLFAALALAEAGYRVEIFERGAPYKERARDLAELMHSGVLNEESNICFGEGGAGTFSDGKLKTRTKSPYIPYILSRFVEFGAPADILYETKAHIGTDYLAKLLPRLRAYLESLGVQYHFNTCVEDLWVQDAICRGVVVGKERLPFQRVILAIGHSEENLLRRALGHGAQIAQKALAVGFRIEHPQALINRIQYGKFAKNPLLPAADYSLMHTASNGLGVYSFCMCPGGVIVPSMTKHDTAVVNGMSSRGRGGKYANSAILVQLGTEYFGKDPLGGFDYLRKLEGLAAQGAPSPCYAPAQKLNDYLAKRTTGKVAHSSYSPGVFGTDLNHILPGELNTAMHEAFGAFDKRMRGFVCEDALLVGAETRSSSPVQVLRNERLEVLGVQALYCVGEGSGYAGGISSSAIDGLRVAKALSEI